MDPLLTHEWHVVARSSDVPPGVPVTALLLEVELVLWRTGNRLHVWRDLCIHRGAKLSLGRVEAECLVCPYHGWTYNSDGVCTRIPAHPRQVPPARARADVFLVEERYELIWVCLGTPSRDIPHFSPWNDSSYRKIHGGPYSFRAFGPRILENFLDVGHLAHVHAGLLGETARPEIDDYEVETSTDGIIARNIPVWQPDPDGTGKPGLVYYTYEVLRPLIATFLKKQGDQHLFMIDIVTPVSKTESRSWAILALNYAHDLPEKQLRDFQDQVTAQDIPIVESQRPELLPLDLQAELHLRSDRTAIAYRQWLNHLGLTYGTA